MDILSPSTYWIGNRCYRVLTHQVENSYNYAEEDDCEDQDPCQDEAACEADLDDFSVETITDGRYRTAWHVPSVLHAFLIGARGSTKKRLEQESGCTITIPPRGVPDNVVVTGSSITKVRTARLRIQLMLDQARARHSPTHFVSVPMNSDTVQQNFLEFKARVLDVCGDSRGVSAALFQLPSFLHVTAGVMVLLDDGERENARLALENAVHSGASLLPAGAVRVRLQGLHYFNDDPSAVSVLYAGVTECDAVSEGGVVGQSSSGCFQAFIDHLMDNMTTAGIMDKQLDTVKIHVTLLNTTFLHPDDETSDERGPRRRPMVTFDAKDILEKFSDFDFGVMEVRDVHLSVMHTKGPEVTYYTATCVLPLIASTQ